jgi:hypothetical protein
MNRPPKPITISFNVSEGNSVPTSNCPHSVSTPPSLPKTKSNSLEARFYSFEQRVKDNNSDNEKFIDILQTALDSPSDPKCPDLKSISADHIKQLLEFLVTTGSLLGSLFSGFTELIAKLNQDSTNSNTPPSKRPPWKTHANKRNSASKDDDDDNPDKRFQGGQPGHAQWLRELLDKNDPNTKTILIEIPEEDRKCSHCGGNLIEDPSKNLQKDHFRLPPVAIEKIIHCVSAYRCSDCGKLHFPEELKKLEKAGLVSTSILTLMLILRGTYHLSIRQIRNYFIQFLGVKFSTGYTNDSVIKASEAFRPSYIELLGTFNSKHSVNTDETTHFNCGDQAYVWTFVSDDATLFKIGTRSRYILDLVFGEDFKGVIGCDCFSTYLSFAKKNGDVELQLCLAHLIREFKFCAEYLREDVSAYGNRCLELLNKIFKVNEKRAELSDKNDPLFAEYTEKLRELKSEFIKLGIDAPEDHPKAQALAKRLKEIGDYYFIFIEDETVPPTNNAAERALRPIVIDRKLTFGTQGLEGVRARETMWTVLATLKKKGIDELTFILDTLNAALDGSPRPSLANPGSYVPEQYVEQANRELENLRKEQKLERKKKKAERKKKSESNRNGSTIAQNESEATVSPIVSDNSVAPSPSSPAIESEPKPTITSPEPKLSQASEAGLKAKPEPTITSPEPKLSQASEAGLKAKPEPTLTSPEPKLFQASETGLKAKPEPTITSPEPKLSQASEAGLKAKPEPTLTSPEPKLSQASEAGLKAKPEPPLTTPEPKLSQASEAGLKAKPEPTLTSPESKLSQASEAGLKAKPGVTISLNSKPSQTSEAGLKAKPGVTISLKSKPSHASEAGLKAKPWVTISLKSKPSQASEAGLKANPGATPIKLKPALEYPPSKVANKFPPKTLSHRQLKAPETVLKILEPALPGLTSL